MCRSYGRSRGGARDRERGQPGQIEYQRGLAIAEIGRTCNAFDFDERVFDRSHHDLLLSEHAIDRERERLTIRSNDECFTELDLGRERK
jgi:hypothetical protein